ncbi:DUF3560 domain-containing protein [Mycolicibacterium llatzerense]|uniref:DUF3560 domain-containing protein n=1 Tax=Mycolicibacterium llatzerense TaxID=280871 RepID=UPI0021B6AA46|nr:DUF3560 domain-containing protein [Mycolicibacterium llatzerense]MCT7373261.1 hypothetical protein [Mycolicibacterium llatzerense]
MSIEIRHDAEDGTLVYGTSRGDGTNDILKLHGFKWFRTLGLWGLPSSRDRQPNRYKIEHAAQALRDAGHEVSTVIDSSHRPVELAEADRAQRADDRADALAAKADRKAVAAESAWEAEARASAAVPEGGEPIKIGHHSEKRHRKSIENAWNKLGKAVEAQRTADTAAERAQTAANANARRHNPVTVKNRLDTMRADHRKDQRILDGYSRKTSPHYTEVHAPASGAYREQVTERMSQRADEITYWEGIYAELQAAGLANTYDKDTIAKGDLVKFRSGWYEVARANAKTVSVYLHAPAKVTYKLGYHELSGHKRPGAQDLDTTTPDPEQAADARPAATQNH